MALQYLTAKVSIIPRIFQPTYDALFSTLPLSQRWRLLLLQPINILGAILTSPTWLFNNRYSVIYIPTRAGKRRCLVYLPPSSSKNGAEGPRPLHVDAHGGGFIGGFPEQNTRWCSYLSDATDAVVVSITYRIAPRHTFPTAHDDVDDIVSWLLPRAKFHYNADPNLLTVGGSSAGGNLALSAAIGLHRLKGEVDGQREEKRVDVKAFVGMCVPVDFRITPEQKPKPPSFPKKDPLSFLMSMYDAYAGPARAHNLENARLNPIVADKEELPRDMVFVVAGLDILLHEQLVFVERLRKEYGDDGAADVDQYGHRDEGRRIEARVWERGFHGWIECKSHISSQGGNTVSNIRLILLQCRQVFLKKRELKRLTRVWGSSRGCIGDTALILASIEYE